MIEDTSLLIVVAEDGGGVIVIPSLLLLQRRVGYPSWCSRGGLFPTWCCRGGMLIAIFHLACEGCDFSRVSRQGSVRNSGPGDSVVVGGMGFRSVIPGPSLFLRVGE